LILDNTGATRLQKAEKSFIISLAALTAVSLGNSSRFS
jgi:hypothetical protein